MISSKPTLSHSRASGPRSAPASTLTRAVRTWGALGSLGAERGNADFLSFAMPGLTDVDEVTFGLSFEVSGHGVPM
ncbi:hypothetical protein GCM10027067_37160 [Pseudactinotalea suaedae]